MEIIHNIEEKGNEICPMHLYTYYKQDGEERYRECSRCWIKHKRTKNGVWKDMSAWTDWRH